MQIKKNQSTNKKKVENEPEESILGQGRSEANYASSALMFLISIIGGILMLLFIFIRELLGYPTF